MTLLHFLKATYFLLTKSHVSIFEYTYEAFYFINIILSASKVFFWKYTFKI